MITTIPFKILAIGGEGFHLMIKLTINRKVANVIIDSGASNTVFDKKRILKYVSEKKFEVHDNLSSGLGTNTMQSHFTTLKKMKIGTIEITDYKTVLLDLSHVNKSYRQVGLKPIDGVLGSDLLLKFKAVIDYEKKQLKLKTTKYLN
jgi:hypothetical protein